VIGLPRHRHNHPCCRPHRSCECAADQGIRCNPASARSCTHSTAAWQYCSTHVAVGETVTLDVGDGRPASQEPATHRTARTRWASSSPIHTCVTPAEVDKPRVETVFRLPLTALPPSPDDEHVPVPANGCIKLPVDTRRTRQPPYSPTRSDPSDSTPSPVGSHNRALASKPPSPLLAVVPSPPMVVITRVVRLTLRSLHECNGRNQGVCETKGGGVITSRRTCG